MADFISIIEVVMQEQGKKIDGLFIDNVISKDTFYKYKKRNPSLKTLLKIANYLRVSIDYMYEFSNENNFIPYDTNHLNFYNNLINLLTLRRISNRKFCKELHYAKDNILRYKKGVEPSLRTLLEIANYLHCSIDDLLK